MGKTYKKVSDRFLYSDEDKVRMQHGKVKKHKASKISKDRYDNKLSYRDIDKYSEY